MRAIKLIMSAFGPYAGKTELALDRLGERGIYLITGDTGSGKTTVFDAITFALYGEASGANREASMLRSKYALPETPTEVEFYFLYDGKEYYVKRNPEYSRPKSRGDGFTTEKANAELHYPDGRVVTKLKEVNNAIVEIMGIDRNQFTQIAMIAQGDFLKLLLASTEDRKKIFQKLFKTQNYYVLQERLKNESGKLGREYETISGSISQYVNGIVCSEDDVLSIQVEKAKENELSMTEILNLLEELIEKDEKTEKEYDVKADTYDSELEEITKNLTRAKTLKAAADSLGALETELAQTNCLKKTLEEKLQAEETKKSEQEGIVLIVAAIEAQLPEYDELDSISEKLNETETAIKENREKLDIKISGHNKSSKLITELETEFKTLETVGTDKAKIDAAKAELINRKCALEKISEEKAALTELEEDLKKAQSKYKEKSEIAKKKKDTYDSLNRAYLDEQAGILAETLADGIACPVCGSVEHPSPAKKSVLAPTKEELENAKNSAENAQEDENEASQKAGQLKGAVTEKVAVIDKLCKELLGEKSLQQVMEDLQEQLKLLEEQLLQIKKAEVRREEIEKLIPKEREKAESACREINALNETIAGETVALENLKTRKAELEEKLQYENKAVAEKVKTEFQARKKALAEALKKAEDEFDACDKNITAIKSKIEENKKLISDAKETDIDAEEEKFQELKNEKEAIVKLQKQVHARKTANQSILTHIKEKFDEIKEVEEKWMWVRSLSNTANGNISGKEKIMLETYIQMTYFDRIISRANTRFMVMSGGQYELKRRKEAENNRSQSGLEINVIDHYNGTERSVKTLSGGESFQASLSLALGLSDEIQSSAGGIKLDSMFVDEGFGSLDSESLSQAIKALSGLAEGNRLVGIISHINELKERIDKQIVVTKDRAEGSRADIIC